MGRKGIVDQNIEPALLTLHLFEEVLHLSVVAVIDANGNPFAPCGGDRRRRLVDSSRVTGISGDLRSARDVHRAAVSAERNRYAPAGASARSRASSLSLIGV